MQRTIDGVTYDTETASRVAFLAMTGFENTLYRTPDGKLFFDLYDTVKDEHVIETVGEEEAKRFCNLPGVERAADAPSVA